MAALLTRARRRIGRILHFEARDLPKHVENSDRGDRIAKRRGYPAIDKDILITEDDRIVNTHWQRPMVHDGFSDPAGELDKNTPIRKMTWAEVSRLRAGRWPRRYRIRSIEHTLAHCAKLKRTAVLEPKDDVRFEDDWPWEHIAKVAEDVGCTVSVRALKDFPTVGAGLRRVEAAKRVGFEAWTI